MTPVERPNLHYPLLWKGGLGVVAVLFGLASMLALMIRIVILFQGKPFVSGVAAFASLFALVLVGRAIVDLVRYRNAELVADDEGVAIVRPGGARLGLPWNEITGYEWRETHFGNFLKLQRADRSVELPLPSGPWMLTYRGMSNVLDWHLTCQGHPTSLKIPDNEVGRRILRHFEAPPPVEMEPNVPYRYADPAHLAKILRFQTTVYWYLYFTLVAMLFNVARVFPDPGLTRVIGVAVLLSVATIQFFANLPLRKSLRDRFVLRDGVLSVIRDGQEIALPPGEPSARRVLGQPLTKHGRGPFAYRMAPQFLEPDVDPVKKI